MPLLIPVVVVVLLLVGWGVDSALNSGKVARNVSVVGLDVGGLDRDELDARLADAAASYASTPVIIRTADKTVETDAGVVGLELDPAATAEEVMAVGRGNVLARPFRWFAGLFGSRTAEAVVTLGQTDEAALDAVVNAGQPEPVEPTLLVADGEVGFEPGRPVQVVDVSTIRDDVLEAARSGANPIEVEAGALQLSPQRSDADIAATAERFNAMTAAGMEILAGEETRTFDAATVRSWLVFGDDQASFTLDPDEVLASLEEEFGGIVADSDAPLEIKVVKGKPRLKDARALMCCADDSADRILAAIEAGETSTELELVRARATERQILADYGVIELISEATTPHDCCQTRVTNIQLFADLITGVIVEPGESLSLNTHVGERTAEKGFVESGVIERGELTTAVGGGISQFATTFFQASFYAGLDIDKYFPHTLWFSRYADFAGRRGIESTISYPEPDVQITNNTPYPILIWPTYTDTSLTVSIYSTKWATTDVLEQREYLSGQCTVIETDREREYPNGETDVDSFRAIYQPADGIGCDGKPTNPESVTPTPEPTPKKKKKKADDPPPEDDGAETTTDDGGGGGGAGDGGGGDAPADGAAADDAPADDSGLGT